MATKFPPRRSTHLSPESCAVFYLEEERARRAPPPLPVIDEFDAWRGILIACALSLLLWLPAIFCMWWWL